MNSRNPGRRYVVKTLGCKANLSDSQALEADLQARGWSPLRRGEPDAAADLCIINSCTVTDEADRQSRKLAAKVKRVNSETTVVMTGCGAEVDPDGMAAAPGVNLVVGNQNKDKIVELILGSLERADPDAPRTQLLGTVSSYEELRSRHPMDREWPAPDASFSVPELPTEGESSRKRAFLKIQEGCNSFCTYCIIPYGRGPNRSARIPEIVARVNELVLRGYREVVVTGTNIGDYGMDWASSPQHGELFAAILRETRIERLRVSSLDPTEITPTVQELMRSDARFCPHFHVSLQSPHSQILRLMKRKYQQADVEACLETIAQLPAPVGGVFVGMDVITGFPGETREIFEESYQLLARLPWSRLHVFPYSERKGTPATRLAGVVPQAERLQRARLLRELSLKRLTALHHQTLAELRKEPRPILRQILIEGPVAGKRWLSGYTPNYFRVLLPMPPDGGRSWSNQLIDAEVSDTVIDPASGDVAFLANSLR